MNWPALLVAVLAPAAALAASKNLPPIKIGDWTYAGVSATTMMFVQPPRSAPDSPYARILVRFEENEPFDRGGFASMSNVELAEVDCARQRTRVVRNVRYSERNMMGVIREIKPAEPAWREEIKGSLGAQILLAACGRGEAA